MIKRIKIENFVLVESQVIEFDEQINVLTGDTGSGKSVIINSIRFGLGTRANSDMFLDKTKSITVTLNIDLTPELAKRLESEQIDFDDEVEVMRSISPSGKNKIRINGELVNLSTLQTIFEDLITIYSQYSVAKFKNENSYLQIIDSQLDEDKLFTEYNQLYTDYLSLKREHEQLQKQSLLKDERQELLEMRLKDMRDVDSEVDIDQLLIEKKELDNQASNMRVNQEASSQFEIASNALNQLISTIELDSHLELLNNALINVDEVSFEIAKASEPIDENRLNYISDYISMARRLARKYNVELDKLSQFKEELEAEYQTLDSIDSDIVNCANKLERQKQATIKVATKISEKRASVIPNFVEQVNSSLKQLSLVESDFRVSLETSELSSTGIDTCNFEVRMNEGGNYTLIHKTASGGEIARFLLAVEYVCSLNSASSFIIFDEIDTGVSGHVATEMAAMMKAISNNHKLLVVTHLAQVAAISQNHFVIAKQTTGAVTTSSATLLNEEQKPNALAKMISGSVTSEEAIAHAKTLIEESRK